MVGGRCEEAQGADDGRSGGNGGPACLTANFQAIAKKNQNIRNKVPTTQPNPQYSAKNNVTINVIAPFMPKCNCHYCQTLSFIVFLSLIQFLFDMLWINPFVTKLKPIYTIKAWAH